MANFKTEVVIDDDILDLVPKFLMAREKDLAKLDQYLEHRDFDSMAKICHTIKGIARPYGFPTLEKICIQLEDAVETQNSEKSQPLLKKMKEYLQSMSAS